MKSLIKRRLTIESALIGFREKKWMSRYVYRENFKAGFKDEEVVKRYNEFL